jgi:hypothetical protein
VTVIVRGTITRVDAGGLYYFQGDRIAIQGNPTVRSHLAKLIGKRVAITTTNPFPTNGQVQVMLVVSNVGDIRVE